MSGVQWTSPNFVSLADYDNDGDLDVYYSTKAGKTNALFRNEGGGIYDMINGLSVTASSSASYSHAWGDIDGDGQCKARRRCPPLASLLSPHSTRRFTGPLHCHRLQPTCDL